MICNKRVSLPALGPAFFGAPKTGEPLNNVLRQGVIQRFPKDDYRQPLFIMPAMAATESPDATSSSNFSATSP